jgi:hypothetical protein
LESREESRSVSIVRFHSAVNLSQLLVAHLSLLVLVMTCLDFHSELPSRGFFVNELELELHFFFLLASFSRPKPEAKNAQTAEVSRNIPTSWETPELNQSSYNNRKEEKRRTEKSSLPLFLPPFPLLPPIVLTESIRQKELTHSPTQRVSRLP